jgi:5,10-methylenetetrahydromethanopterin reductase
VKIGTFLGEVRGANSAERVISRVRQAEEQGFSSVWIPSGVAIDAFQAATLGAIRTSSIEIGTAVVPIFTRHPIVMAQQALTTQSMAGGRFVLGIGLSHRAVIETVYGYPYANAVGKMRDYLRALLPLVNGEPADVRTEHITAKTVMAIEAPPTQVLLAAMGPKMLDVAGTQADGTIAWMTGPKTLAQHTVPRLRAAADRVGRPAPRVVAALPVCVTDDVAAATERAAAALAIYMQFPSYRAMVEMEGASGPEGVSIIGGEAHVLERLAEFAAIGVTDYMAVPFSRGEEADRTVSLLTGELSHADGS